ncbi:MAG: BTAD domain-containing putative transcriptional regulator [Mycobacteriales bacterium]
MGTRGIRLLGPVEVWAGTQQVITGPPRLAAVLAVLAVEAGRPVSPQVVVERVWGLDAPYRARRTLHTYVSQVRQLVARLDAAGGPVRLVRQTGGYLLEIDPDEVDVRRFWRLVAAARRSGTPAPERVAQLREATGLWQGEPLSGVPGEWADRMRQSWRRQYADAVVDAADAELRAGDPVWVLDPLIELAEEFPLSEPLAAALMRVLVAAGRPAEALDRYARVRKRLTEELGADPGPGLAALHQAVLRGDHEPPAPVQPVPLAAAVVPAQLPAEVSPFVGRVGVLAQLDALLDTTPAAPVVVAVSGTAGVGKTALAVRWARRVADRFPDGQLYVNLHGFDSDEHATAPPEAVRDLLYGLGVSAGEVPSSPDAKIALYRSLLGRKRLLVVLDNARTADQARPLLPGGGTNFTLVTSRDSLAGLVAVNGAHPITLDVLSDLEARQLLAGRLGTGPVDAEPDAVTRVVAACARLPLALAIAAARIQRTGFPLAILAEELAEVDGRLDALDTGDAAGQVRAVLSWSYRTLSADAARLFRLLAVHPGPAATALSAASLAGIPVRRAAALLAELARAQLAVEPVPGRYSLHDLLRVYAAELAEAHDGGVESTAATRRVLDHYALTASAAAALLNPYDDPVPPPEPVPGVVPEPLATEHHALAWYQHEYPALSAALRHAASAGLHPHAVSLGGSLWAFLRRQGRWHAFIGMECVVTAAAQAAADLPREAQAHRVLAAVLTHLGRYEEACGHLTVALDLGSQHHDAACQAETHRVWAWTCDQRGDHRAAVEHSERALDRYRDAGDLVGQARSLNAIGWYLAQLGRYGLALASCERGLALLGDSENYILRAATWDSLGFSRQRLGDHRRAVTCYQHAIDLYRRSSHRYGEAESLDRLGDAHEAAGDHVAARAAWRTAAAVLDGLGHPAATTIRAKLPTPVPPF